MSDDPFGQMSEDASERLGREAILRALQRRMLAKRVVAMIGAALAVVVGTVVGHWVDGLPREGIPRRAVGAGIGTVFGAFLGLVGGMIRSLGDFADEGDIKLGLQIRLGLQTFGGMILGGAACSYLLLPASRRWDYSAFWYGLAIGSVASILAGCYLVRTGRGLLARSIDTDFRRPPT